MKEALIKFKHFRNGREFPNCRMIFEEDRGITIVNLDYDPEDAGDRLNPDYLACFRGPKDKRFSNAPKALEVFQEQYKFAVAAAESGYWDDRELMDIENEIFGDKDGTGGMPSAQTCAFG